MSTSFSPQFIDEMQQKLLADKAKLEKELGSVGVKNASEASDLTAKLPNYSNEMGDEESSAQEVADYEVNINIEQDLKCALRDTDKALQRLTDGTYGICKYCQKPIPEERLRARPTSSSCVDCKKTILQEV